MLSRLLIDALWSPEGKGLTSWLLFVRFILIFPPDIMGQVWYLIVWIPGPCSLSFLSSDKADSFPYCNVWYILMK